MKEAKKRRYCNLKLETGSMAFFEPARNLYSKHGFAYCGPFGSYKEDPNSVFMMLDLNASGRAAGGLMTGKKFEN